IPPSPDATVTYWRPLWVYVIAVELTLEPVLNCQSVLPVSSSSAMNSPVNLPVNTSPPPVTSMPAELGRSVNGTSHFFSPVNGLIAAVAEDVAWLHLRLPRINTRRLCAENLRLGCCDFLEPRYVPRAGVDRSRVRIERDGHRIRASRRPDFNLLSGSEPFVDVRQHRPAGGQIDMGGPIDFDDRVRGDQFAVGAVE